MVRGWRKGRFFPAPEWSTIFGDSFFQGQIPFIPPFTSHSCETAPVGILLMYKLLWVQIPSEMLEIGNIIWIRHSYCTPVQLLGFYPEQNSPAWGEFKATHKHQLLINGLWGRRKYQIPQKLFQDLLTLPDNIICISSLLDPLFITQLRRGKTTFYLSQRLHEFWAPRQSLSSDFCHPCAEWISPSWVHCPENTFCLTEQPRGGEGEHFALKIGF